MAKDQYLQHLLNFTVEDIPQIQFMLDIRRCIAVACQYLLEKFLHLLTNLALMCRDAYMKYTHNTYTHKSLGSSHLSSHAQT